MAFVAPAFAALGGGSALLGGATALSALGSGLGVIQSIRQGNFQSEIAARQAVLADQNAAQTRQRGAIEAQETDFAALAEMSRLEARRAGSGFELGSTSFNRSRRLERMLASRDRLRIVDQAEREALTLENQAASSRSEGKAAKRAGLFNAVGGALNLGSDLINSATFVNRRKVAQLGLAD